MAYLPIVTNLYNAASLSLHHTDIYIQSPQWHVFCVAYLYDTCE